MKFGVKFLRVDNSNFQRFGKKLTSSSECKYVLKGSQAIRDIISQSLLIPRWKSHIVSRVDKYDLILK